MINVLWIVQLSGSVYLLLFTPYWIYANLLIAMALFFIYNNCKRIKSQKS